MAFPISIKGVLLEPDGVVLLENERGEWELPGGQLESGETPEKCLAREIEEELGIGVTIGPLVDCWLYEVLPGREVAIVTYGLNRADDRQMRHSSEHSRLGIFKAEDVSSLPMPDGYKRSIQLWIASLKTIHATRS